MMPPLLSLMVWIISTVLAYVLIFLMFDLQDMRPWLRRTAILLSGVALTARIIRTEMGDHHPDPIWGNTPLKSSLWITIFFGVLADIGAPSLIIVGLLTIMIDAIWIAEHWATRVGPFF
jgi:hypothetical protein